MATKFNSTEVRSVTEAGTGQTAPLILTGLERIRAEQPRLRQLADTCGQAGAADYIDYFLTQPYTGGKRPHLLLFHGQSEQRKQPPEGAVLVHQYRWAGVPLPIFVTEDAGGERNVLGSPQTRSATAVRAARHLLSRGAHLVLISLKDADFKASPQPSGAQPSPNQPDAQWALRHRTLLRRMPLLGSYQATLNTLGAHTRRNFRLFRRRGIAAYGCEFVPQVGIDEHDFLALNALCDYPVPPDVALWRFRSRQATAGGVLAGVRSAGGEWISMAGGRRSHGTFTLDWQMNRTEFAGVSPATLMRGFLMEHESGLGTASLLFQGGTPHSMQSAFQPEHVTDLVASSGRWPANLLRLVAGRLHLRENLLLQSLASGELQWHAGISG